MDRLDQIAIRNTEVGRPIVVLDDDPTGTQTVHDVPVLTVWDTASLTKALETNQVVYLLTNSRALGEKDAMELAATIGNQLRFTGLDPIVISRSDSTLRGHFPAEVDALGLEMDLTLLVPYFGAGGRLTVDGIHHLVSDGRMVPVSETEFADDPRFGYRSSYLPEWVEEKSGGRIRASQVTLIRLADLREGGPSRVAELLENGAPVAVSDVTDDTDLEILVLGLQTAERSGLRVVSRTAASFVRVRAGMREQPLLSPEEIVDPKGSGGLVLVGSFVPTTTRQVAKLRAIPDIKWFEIDVGELIGGRFEPAAMTGAVAAVLESDGVVVIESSRSFDPAVKGEVSDALCRIVSELSVHPRFLMVKGGITSSDIATRGLGVRAATVLGQLLPGVPVWRLGPEASFPGLAYVVFPGNVGSADSLALAVQGLIHAASLQTPRRSPPGTIG